MSDYLWDKSGTDPEVEALEKLLGPAGYRGARAPAAPPEARPKARRWFCATAAAAVILLAGVTVYWLRSSSGPAYRVVSDDGDFAARRGATIDAAGKPLTIELAGIGVVVAEAQARLRVLQIGEDLHKLRLERGTIHATIGAFVRPGLFQVETPATTCVDLGCHYTLTVDEQGRSLVHVETGRVAFVDGAREVYVPRGARCVAWPGGRGSGTPVFEDAPEELCAAIDLFDRGSGERVTAARALVEAASRRRDLLSVWHLLQDRDDAVVAVAFDALVARYEVPVGGERGAVMRREAAAREAWKQRMQSDWF